MRDPCVVDKQCRSAFGVGTVCTTCREQVCQITRMQLSQQHRSAAQLCSRSYFQQHDLITSVCHKRCGCASHSAPGSMTCCCTPCLHHLTTLVDCKAACSTEKQCTLALRQWPGLMVQLFDLCLCPKGPDCLSCQQHSLLGP